MIPTAIYPSVVAHSSLMIFPSISAIPFFFTSLMLCVRHSIRIISRSWPEAILPTLSPFYSRLSIFLLLIFPNFFIYFIFHNSSLFSSVMVSSLFPKLAWFLTVFIFSLLILLFLQVKIFVFWALKYRFGFGAQRVDFFWYIYTYTHMYIYIHIFIITSLPIFYLLLCRYEDFSQYSTFKFLMSLYIVAETSDHIPSSWHNIPLYSCEGFSQYSTFKF